MVSIKTNVLKFGGTSLQDASFIRQAAKIVAKRHKESRIITVVSAISGVTNTLIELAEQPEPSDALIDKLEQKHLEIYSNFEVTENGHCSKIHELFSELRQVCADETFRESNYQAWKDRVLSYGERASAIIFSATLHAEAVPAIPVFAHEIIKTDSRFSEASVDLEQSRVLINEKLTGLSAIPVITGFIGSDTAGAITTLGRSGSDYTAGIIAAAVDAELLEIWTDVDGVLSADPKWVPTADNIDLLSFADIEELSAHGANVIHPKTIQPVRSGVTSVIVKNSYNPTHPGTTIKRDFSSNGAFKTITVTGPFVQMKVDDAHAFSFLGELNRLSANKTNTFSFKRNSSYEAARFLIDQSFFKTHEIELLDWASKYGVILEFESELYKVKKFSNHFNDSERLMNRIWNLLANRHLHPFHVERNNDERFVSFLFKKNDAEKAARLFDTYLHHQKKTIDIFIAGNGAVGGTLLQQLHDLKKKEIEFRLIGICNSRQYLWNAQGIDYREALNWGPAKPTDWNSIVNGLTNSVHHNCILVDATGNKEIARLYPKLLTKGVHIVTPSKLANTAEQAYFDELQAIAAENGASFRYETTVGAGLPVISTLKNLLESGDEIREVSGVVSGTMTYIFNQVENGTPFSEAVVNARQLGYAEPDPRDDLSGEDVARKFLTIARTVGLKVERESLEVESLIPKALTKNSRIEFLEKLPEYDLHWKERFEEARKRNETLRYTGLLKEGNITVGIQAVPLESPMGLLKGTDNILQITTCFYNKTPLIIQGAGAGKQVTAAGVMSDILKISKQLY